MSVTLYGTPGTVGTTAGQITRAIKAGFEATARGELVRVHRHGELLDHEGLRQWFRDKLDRLINLKAGLRDDGAPLKVKAGPDCNCAACDHRRIVHAGVFHVRCMHCPSRGHQDYGRKWDQDYFARAWRDSRAARDRVQRRVVVRRFETAEANARLGHLLSPNTEY